MTPNKQKKLNQYLQEIAEILYEESDPETIKELAGIEETIRKLSLEYITPQIGFFLSKKQQQLMLGDSESSRV